MDFLTTLRPTNFEIWMYSILKLNPWTSIGIFQSGDHHHRLVRTPKLPNLVTMWTAQASEESRTYHYTLGMDAYGHPECVFLGGNTDEASVALSHVTSMAVEQQKKISGGKSILKVGDRLEVIARRLEDTAIIAQFPTVVRKRLPSSILLLQNVSTVHD